MKVFNMERKEAKKRISYGKDSHTQFKQSIREGTDLAAEMVAFSNARGGVIFVGVEDKTGKLVGLSEEQVRTYNQIISNTASQQVNPVVYPITHNLEIEGKRLIAIEISEGTQKPYQTRSGHFYNKSGSDKRKVSVQELGKLLQNSGQLYWDETRTQALADEQTDWPAFLAYCSRHFPEAMATGLPREHLLKNLNCEREGYLNLTGLLLFGKNPERFLPMAYVHAVAFFGTDIAESEFLDKMEVRGTLLAQYDSSMAFLKRNLRRIQVPGMGFNQPGKWEISEKSLQEALVNALLHRDYAYPASIRILIFSDRVEITSPGRLPNHLQIDQIKTGISFVRNQILTRLATLILPYEGLGSGIRRMLAEHPETELISDERRGEQFSVVFKRPAV